MGNQSSSQVKIQFSRVAEITANYKSNPDVLRAKISSSEKAAHFIRQIFPVQLQHREAMVALFLDRSNSTVGYSVISIGGLSGTVCDPKILFQAALLAHASGIIIAHNHPSGNLNPSQADILLTKKVKSAGELLDMPLFDHVILTEESHYSFADDGAL